MDLCLYPLLLVVVSFPFVLSHSFPVLCRVVTVPTLLQESQRMQTKLDALTREVFDLQETINWKDKKIGVGCPTGVLRQNMKGNRWSMMHSLTFDQFVPVTKRKCPSSSFASHVVSAWWRPVGISTYLGLILIHSLDFCMSIDYYGTTNRVFSLDAVTSANKWMGTVWRLSVDRICFRLCCVN